jgi:hypothetical protein
VRTSSKLSKHKKSVGGRQSATSNRKK